MSSKIIKLVFFHPYSHLGGADNSLRRLIENLDLNKFSITFISLNKSYLNKVLSNKVIFKRIKVSRTILSIFKLRKIILNYEKNNSFKKIIVISNQNYANLAVSFSIKSNKKIKTIYVDRNHLDELNFSKNIVEKLKKKILKFLIKIRYHKADLVVGISKKLSKDLSKHINKNVKTIYSPSYDKKIIKKAKEKLNLPKKYKYIINVSRFSVNKDHPTTLKAFKLASNKIKNLKLILIGHGTELSKIKSLAKELNIYNRIIIINKTLNPYKYMRKSKLLILTSVYEGFPNVLNEALTLGTPVISSNANAGASEILLNGKGGDLIKIKDYKNLSKKIINHFKFPKKLQKKTIFAQKNLYRFEAKRHCKIYTNLFKNI
jgi:glycosyltransferase involved in cell wall biosynthesis